MPNIKLVKSSKIPNSFKTNLIKGKFDIDKDEISENFEISFELPEYAISSGLECTFYNQPLQG